MLLDIILLIIIGASIAGILYLIIRKLPQLKTLDLDTVPEERRARMRDRILFERMKRRTQLSQEFLKKKTVPVFASTKQIFRVIFSRISALERKYREQSEVKVKLTGVELKSKISGLLEEAGDWQKNNQLSEAEKKYIEIISLDHKNTAAYKGLAEVYRAMREYKQAVQTYQFLLQMEAKKSKVLKKKDDFGNIEESVSNAVELAELNSALGHVFELMDNKNKALENYNQARVLEPNNPKHLAQVIELGIALKQKRLALDALKKLTEVNPENQKLGEYGEKVKNLELK